MPFGWGVIGPGGFTDGNMAPAFRQAKDSRLVAVLSRSKERADAFAKAYAGDAGYDKIEQFLRHPGLDAVYIGTPNNLHASSAIPAMNAGKHVLCDISMAVTEADCIAMIQSARKNKVKFGMEYQPRYHPANADMKRMIDTGEIGDIIMIKAACTMPFGGHGVFVPQKFKVPSRVMAQHSTEWKEDLSMRGGGVTAFVWMFAVDMVRFLTGKDVEEVFAYTDVATAPRGQETICMGNFRFQGGIHGFVDCARPSPYADNNVTVYGTKGRLTSLGGLRLDSDGALEGVTEKGSFRKEYTGYNMYVDEVEAFIRCVRENREPSASGIDGWRERQISIAVIESSRQNKPIRINLSPAPAG